MQLRNKEDDRIIDVDDEHAYVLEALGWEQLTPPAPKPRARRAKAKPTEE